jgi:dihydroflavonol-4-reductase
MRILVTGGTGYIGLALLRRMPDRHKAVVMVRDRSRTELLPANTATVVGDVTNSESVRNAMNNVDAVAHLAGVNPGSKNDEAVTGTVTEETFVSVNVDGTRNVVKAAADAGVESLVYTSTTNSHPNIPYEYDSTYVETKRRGGDVVAQSGVKYTIVHPTYVMGPADYRLKRFDEFRLAAANLVLVPPIYTPGRINIVHVDTVADSIVYYLEQPTNDRHPVSGPNVDRRTYAKHLASLSDRRSVVLPFPFHKSALPLVVRAVDALGLANVDPESLALDEQTGVVPSIYERRAPVERKSWRQAVTDTYRWYERVQLL